MHPPRERVFNIPAVVLGTVAAIALIHAVFAFLLSDQQTNALLIVFAFIPERYDWSVLAEESWWIGWGPAVWTFVSYAFIHIDLNHLFFNLIWLVAFGTPVARRFGTTRFLAFFLATAAAGALMHLAVHFGEQSPMIGASAAISGAMAGAMRFAFQRGGPLGLLGRGTPDSYRVPAVPVVAMLRDRRVLVFLVVWFGTNLVFGIGIVALPGAEQSIAWEAHIGGFLAGLFGFALFDPPPLPPAADRVEADQTIGAGEDP